MLWLKRQILNEVEINGTVLENGVCIQIYASYILVQLQGIISIRGGGPRAFTIRRKGMPE